jgi:hypothetical protein
MKQCKRQITQCKRQITLYKWQIKGGKSQITHHRFFTKVLYSPYPPCTESGNCTPTGSSRRSLSTTSG